MSNIIDFLDNTSPNNFVRILKSNNVLNNNNLKGGFNNYMNMNSLISNNIPVLPEDIDKSIILMGNQILELDKKIEELEKEIAEDC